MAEKTPGGEKLETVTCTRCGGTGTYPSSAYHGICLGCGGSGIKYTKRGAAAKHFLDELRTVPASTIKVGDLVRMDGVPGFHAAFFFRVTEIRPTPERPGQFDLVGQDAKGQGATLGGLGATSKVRRGFSAAEKAEQFQKALAFQATLTDRGTPRKRPARAKTPPPPTAPKAKAVATVAPIKVVAVWGQSHAQGWEKGQATSEVGWVRARAKDGSCYLYNGSQAHEFRPSVSAFCDKVRARGQIDPRYWQRTSGPEAQETSQEAEYRDANER